MSKALWWRRLAQVAREAAANRGRPPKPLAWRDAVRLARAGFVPSSYTIYGLDRNDPQEYLSDRDRHFTWMINVPAAGLLNDKLAFFFMMRHIGAPTPAIRAVVRDGRVCPLDASGEIDSVARLRTYLDASGRVVLKPIRGAGGGNVLILESAAGTYRANLREEPWEAIERRLVALDDYLVSDFVDQAAYAREIFAETTNTIRVLTMHGPAKPFIAGAVHRFGRTSSLPVDNWTRGGLSARIDERTGALGVAAGLDARGGVVWHEWHPDSGAAIAGTEIPGWKAIRDGVLAAARRTAFLPYVAWDLVATDSGFQLIEGNSSPDVRTLQVHEPLLRSSRTRAFYASHGIR